MTASRYAIRVEGHLAPHWSAWFEGLRIRCHEDGTTTLAGPIKDQAALYGVLLKVRDLGLRLIAVVPVGSGEPEGVGVPASKEPGEEEQRGQDG